MLSSLATPNSTPGNPYLQRRSTWALWLVPLGFAAMYLPSYWRAANGLWQTDEFAHGPLILLVAAWLFWSLRDAINATPTRPDTALGWVLLGVGLAAYLFGRVLNVSSIEFLSQIAIVASLLLMFKGRPSVKVAWFAVFYLVFMVPLPASFTDMLTAPLKQMISRIIVDGLFALGYPISRTGVMISIGQYQLLVADACSGLNSMFSLSALGTLYMYLMKRESWLHNTVMLLAILPIAFAANIARVFILVLITYHFGDEAGQGFLHGAAGIVLMLVALALFFCLDAVLKRIFPQPHAAKSQALAD
jgi:exosortase B